MTKIHRQIALNWWNTLDADEQSFKVIKWLESKNRATNERLPNSLTGSEIEEIMDKEAQEEAQSILNLGLELNE